MCKINYNCTLFLFNSSYLRYNLCDHYSVVKEGKNTAECLLPLVTTGISFYCPLSMAALLHRKPAFRETNSEDGYLKLLQQHLLQRELITVWYLTAIPNIIPN
jgi:hypothetical protein